MHHISSAKPNKTWQIERLVQESPEIGIAADPLEPGWKAGFHSNERDGITFFLKLAEQSVRLVALTAYALQAGSHDGDATQFHFTQMVRWNLEGMEELIPYVRKSPGGRCSARGPDTTFSVII